MAEVRSPRRVRGSVLGADWPGGDFMLRSRRLVTPEGEVDGAVVVRRGVVAEITTDTTVFDADVDVDVGDLAVLPGGVDTHVHLNEPGRTDWEGLVSGTRAAAAGGITTLVDMPLNSDPVTVNVEALRVKAEAAAYRRERGELWADIAFWGGLIAEGQGALDGLWDAGVAGFKAFMAESGIDTFPPVRERDLEPAMRVMEKLGAPLLVHAEWLGTSSADPSLSDPSLSDPSLSDPSLSDPSLSDPDRYATWLAARPPRFEVDAVRMLLRAVERTGCHLHVVHVAAAEVLPLLRAAKDAGLPVTAETCPHYLFFDAESLPDGDPRFKCAPPIRGLRHRDALWQAVFDGTLDLIASDHSPAPPSMKGGSLMAAWGGISSLEVARSAVWTGASRRGAGLCDLARWTASAPARLAGLTGKGVIEAGTDADLVVFDPDALWRVDARALQHRHPETAYDGVELRGRVDSTYLAGRLVWPPPVRGALERKG